MTTPPLHRTPALAMLMLMTVYAERAQQGPTIDADSLPTLFVKEDLRIGSVDDPKVGFSAILTADIDRDGQFFVYDSQEREIRVLSREGRPLRTIGHAGNGPGEFTRVTAMGVFGDSVWTVKERRFGGAVLGQIIGIAIGPDSAVYVLDLGYQKVAVFHRDGTLRRLILGGYGRGPGEFVFPRSISVSSEGMVAVLDRGLNRITLFDSTGAYRNLFPLPGTEPYSLVFATPDELYVLQRYTGAGAEHMVHVFSTDGVHRRSEIAPDERQKHVASYGYPGTLARSVDGRPVFAYATPGLWTLLGRGNRRAMGRDLFPTVLGVVTRGPRGTAVRNIEDGTVAAGSFGPSLMGIAYHRWRDVARSPNSPQWPDLILVSVDSMGVVRDSVNLTADLGAFPAHATPFGTWDEFYVSQIDPYPRVLRCRLRQFRQSNRAAWDRRRLRGPAMPDGARTPRMRLHQRSTRCADDAQFASGRGTRRIRRNNALPSTMATRG